MPQVVAAATVWLANAIVMNTAVGIVAAHAIASFVVRTVTSFAISAIVGALTKPKLPTSSLNKDRTLTLRQPTAARRVIYGRVRVGGTMLFAHVDGRFLHLVVEWAGHECESIESLWLGDTALTLDGSGVPADTKYDGFLWCNHHLGDPNQEADTDLINALPEYWTVNHRLRGRCYSYIKLKKNQNLFPSGLPNLSVVIKGKKVYDTRTGSTTWSNNTALCVADYLTDQVYGLGCVFGEEIDATALTAAANVCDESVSLADGGSESRYACNGSIDTNVPHKQVLADLTSAMAGAIIWRHGRWVVSAGAYDTPTITLTADDFRSALSVKTGVSRRDLVNGVKGLYVSEGNFWQPADYPAITNELYKSQDGGQRLWRDLDLPFTVSAATAQRIAKITLERVRQQISVTAPCRLSALRAIAGGTINLTYDRFGWSSKPFEIERWAFVVYQQDNAPVLGVDLELREIAAEVFDWNSGEETTVDPAPNTLLPSPFTVGVPNNVEVESGSDHLLLMTDGSILPRIHVTWDEPEDFFTVNYEVQYRKTSELSWRNAASALGDPAVTFGPVVEGEQHDIRVRSVSGIGTRSAWVEHLNHIVVGKSEPPSKPDSFSVERLPDGTRRFSWTHVNAPVDVRVGGGYEIRYYLGATADWSAMTAMHTGLLTASPWETNQLAAGTYTLAIKSVDSTQHYSDDAVFIQVELGDPRLQNVIFSQYDHLDGWPGTKVNCSVINGWLIADATSDIGDLPTQISSLATTINSMVTSSSPITYTTVEIDLGLDISFTPLVTVVGDGTPTVQMKTGTSADGGVTGSFTSLGFVQSARYLQIQVSMADAHPVIKQLSVLVDSETAFDNFEDVNTATESAAWFSRTAAGHFKVGSKSGDLAAISSASISALQSVGAGWTWELISKSETVNSQPAAEFKIYNAGGTLADAVIDVYLRGPKNG